ncbi:MAG: CooT family nickel-binding protein [Thermoleophilia bacterium]|nr:CooT family nickel-binding protein [Thermoleophilia bacterium]
MCELTVYLQNEEKEEKLMEDVATIIPDGERLVLTDLLGQQKIVEARIKELRLLEHKVYLTR